MPTPFWQSADEASASQWMLLQVGEVVVPGLTYVEGNLTRDVQVKKAKGKDGATITDNGYQPASFSTVTQIWSDSQWDEYQRTVVPLLDPRKKGKERTAHRLSHPSLTVAGVREAYLVETQVPRPGEDGILYLTHKWLEYIPKPKPKGPIGRARRKGIGTDEEINLLVAESERVVAIANEEKAACMESGTDPATCESAYNQRLAQSDALLARADRLAQGFRDE